MKKSIFVLITFFVISCKTDKCGNSGKIWGKYINTSNQSDYILINEDGTYLQYYKSQVKIIKINTGKWKLSKAEDCKIYFDNWKDIVGYVKMDEISHNYANYRNNKLMFFEDIDNADYKKEE